MPARAPPAAALALLFVLPVACIREPAESARALYARYCTECHGSGGRGDGALAALQGGRVPDLTGLSARNGGSFPMGYAIRAVGRPRELHGRIIAMPDFADLLGGRPIRHRTPEGEVLETTATVLRIAGYLREIQEPADGGG